MRFRFSPIIFLLLGTFPLFGFAEEAALPLKLDRTFKKTPPPSEGGAAFISAQHVEAKKDDQLEANGNVELRQGRQVISAGHLVYGQVSKDVLAVGDVRIQQPGSVVSGPVLKLNLDTYLGEMLQPRFEFSENHARGAAESVQIAGRMNYIFEDASYTTCPAGNDDWLLRMSRLDIDRTTQVGVAHHARVEFKGVPILYTPWMDFGLNDNRRSGFLGPTFGSTNKGGTEMTLPYYWNIAPNYDATIAPRMIARRGTQFNNEFRYMNPSYVGQIQYEVLPYDRMSKLQRNRVALVHSQSLGGGVGSALNLNRVSDDEYFRDLSTLVSGTSQTNLLREGVLTYGADWWSASAKVQRYQTLQDPLAPVVLPYRRQPQLSLNAQDTLADADIRVASEYVDFRHDTAINAQRLVLYPSMSYPLLSDLGYYMTPKLGVHHTEYRMGANNSTSLPDASRTLPVFSTDTGMVFERDDSFLGNGYVQTLEPRLFYVYVPYRDQSQLPNFDSAQAPFNFAQVFTENRFFGSDRVGDANMATLALTSRAIDAEDGSERLRVMVGERFSFTAPRVNLVTTTGNTNTSRSDILLSIGGRVSKAWTLDSLFQYNPNQSHTESYYTMARYNPEAGKLLNLGYRFTRNTLRQADVSAQWPLFARWHGVARLNYSLQDHRSLEALGGLEYNQACWAMRFVAQSFTSATRERSTGVFLQLELNDLVRIGSDPLDALRSSVTGYTKLNSIPAEQPEDGLR
ncbi:MAG: organic solvent tolerance protein [Sideroxydans sp. GWF2_59_14]|nr:MAG: organic solvent tolerance protein [Sideroxydans sp. GWF2_59_14]HAF44376.1 LPS-assembly protein LptD [Gallionellaceae bacterium]